MLTGTRHIQVGAFAAENLVRFYGNENVQVAVFAAAAASFSGARNPHSGVVFNAGRNFDFKRFVFVDHAAAAAFFAGFLNQTPAAFAFWAGCLDDEKPPCC